MLKNKVAFVTGAEGIGAASARRLAREGAKVGILSRTREDIEALIDEIEQLGSEGLGFQGDVSNANEVQSALAELHQRWGRLDIVFANAGVNGTWAPIEELSVEDWRKTIDINLTGTFLTVKYAVPWMTENGGSIIITASVNGTRMFSNSGASAYASSKAAQVAFAKMMALELAPKKIRVNVICPGAIDTEDAWTTRNGRTGSRSCPFPRIGGVQPDHRNTHLDRWCSVFIPGVVCYYNNGL